MRERFVDQHLRENPGRRIGDAGRTVHVAAGPPTEPVAPRVERRVLIHDDERKSQAVRDRIPGVFVTEIENRFERAADEREPLAGIVEVAEVFAGDVGDRGIARKKCKAVPDQQDSSARSQIGNAAVRRKCVINAIRQAHAVQIQRDCADVLQLQVFKIVGAVGAPGGRWGGMIHDFRDDQLRRGDDECGGGHARPRTRQRRFVQTGQIMVIRIVSAGQHTRVGVQRDGCRVNPRGWRTTSAREAWINAVGGVVNGCCRWTGSRKPSRTK